MLSNKKWKNIIALFPQSVTYTSPW